MPKYLFRGSYTAEGMRDLTQGGAAQARRRVEGRLADLGASLEAFYWAYGEDDFYAIVDAPDGATATAASLAINAEGLMRLSTVVLITAEELDQAIGRI